MPEVKQVQTLLPSNGEGTQIPWDLRQKMLAGQLAQQEAAAPTAPYTSRTAGLLKALQGGLGGLMEGAATQQVMQGQDENRQHMALLLSSLKSGTTVGGAPGGAASAPPASVTSAGQGASPSTAGGGSAPVSTASNNAFIQSIMPDAQRVGAKLGIDPRLVAAQAALESNYGKSAPGNNFFGIKGAGTGPISTMESVNGQMVPTKASFATFASPAASFDGYSKLMSGDRYAGVRSGATLGEQVQALGKSGYATDPNYAAKVGAIAHSIPATTAAADAPAPNAQPVASNTLPPGIAPDMVSAPPTSDGTLRGDLMAAAAQHGGLDPDAPAPGATPTGMAGLPPSVTPAMFAASQNTATDGNALHRNDEIPAGTKPYMPGSTPGPVTGSGVPHQVAPGASARADSGVGAGIGGGPSDTKLSPAADPSGYLDPEGTGSDNYAPNAGPSLRDQIAAAMNKGPDLGQTAPAVVPPPVMASTPDAPPPPSILPPARPPSGDVAAAPVVPPPQGDLTAPPAPQDPPASDGSLRGDLLAAASAHGMDVAGSPVVPPPQGDLTAPPTASAPDAVGAGLAAGKDVGLDPVVPDPQGSMVAPAPSSPNMDLAGPQSDAAMGNTAPDAGPSLRDTIAAQFGSGAGTTGPQSDAAAPLAPTGVDQSAGPAPIAALGATPDAPSSGPAATPSMTASAPLVGGPAGTSSSPVGPPSAPQPGTGDALPSTGPMPPLGGQSLAAASSLPQPSGSGSGTDLSKLAVGPLTPIYMSAMGKALSDPQPSSSTASPAATAPSGGLNPRGGVPSMAQQPAPSAAAAPQPQGQDGGYLPGAARGPAPAAPQGQGAPPQQQGAQAGQRPAAPSQADAIAQAQAAIAKGAPRAAVMQRLQSMGINTAGL